MYMQKAPILLARAETYFRGAFSYEGADIRRDVLRDKNESAVQYILFLLLPRPSGHTSERLDPS